MIRYKIFRKITITKDDKKTEEIDMSIYCVPTSTPTPTSIEMLKMHPTSTPTPTPIEMLKMHPTSTPMPTSTTENTEILPEENQNHMENDISTFDDFDEVIRDFNITNQEDEDLLQIPKTYSISLTTLRDVCSNFSDTSKIINEITGQLDSRNFCIARIFRIFSDDPMISLIDGEYWLSNGLYGRKVIKTGRNLRFNSNCVLCGSEPNTMYVRYNTFLI